MEDCDAAANKTHQLANVAVLHSTGDQRHGNITARAGRRAPANGSDLKMKLWKNETHR